MNNQEPATVTSPAEEMAAHLDGVIAEMDANGPSLAQIRPQGEAAPVPDPTVQDQDEWDAFAQSADATKETELLVGDPKDIREKVETASASQETEDFTEEAEDLGKTATSAEVFPFPASPEPEPTPPTAPVGTDHQISA